MEPTLREFNDIIMELFTAYRRIASRLDVTENELWILYELIAEEQGLLQRELCERLGLAKQTINSALQKMEAAGHIQQKPGSDRRTKEISLTPAGREQAERTAGWLMRAETAALEAMGPQKCQAMFKGLREYTHELRKQ